MDDALERVLRAAQQVRTAAARHAESVEALLGDTGEQDLRHLAQAKRAADAGEISQAEYGATVDSYLLDPRQEAVEEAWRRLRVARVEHHTAVEAFLQG